MVEVIAVRRGYLNSINQIETYTITGDQFLSDVAGSSARFAGMTPRSKQTG
jgi:hypothetical protein